VTASGLSKPKHQATPAPFGGASGRAVLVGLIGAAALFLAWMAAGTLLLIFAGLLFAALLDACTRGLSNFLPLPRGVNLAIVSVILAIIVAGLLFWSGVSIALQINDLVRALNQQLHALEQGMAALGVTSADANGHASPISHLGQLLFPNPHQLFGEARNAFTFAVGGIGEAVIVVLIGLFVAIDPGAYRRGLVELMPPRRSHMAGIVLDETALYLRRWLIGQLAAMLLLAILTSIVLVAFGVPSPLLLAIQAGLFNFVPYLGAIIAAAPILLMTLPLGTTTLLIILGLYTVIHVGVGYAIVPLIQKQAVHLPPALTLASLVLFGALFGVASVVVATPIVAAIRHAAVRFHHYTPADAEEDAAA
jgi:predicted PurR-regulated permease PerM